MKFIYSLFFAVLIVVITLSGLNASRISTLQMADDKIQGQMYGFIMNFNKPISVDVNKISATGETEKVVNIPAGPVQNDYRIGAQNTGKNNHIVAWCSSGAHPWIMDIVDLKAGKLLNTWSVNDTEVPLNMFWDNDELMLVTQSHFAKFDQKEGKIVHIKPFPNPTNQGTITYNPTTRTAMMIQVPNYMHGGNAFFWDLKDNSYKEIKYTKNYQWIGYTGDGSGTILGMALETNSTGKTAYIAEVDPSLNSYTKLFEADNEHVYADWYSHVYDSEHYVMFTILMDKMQAYSIPKDSSKKTSLLFDVPFKQGQITVDFAWIPPSQ